MAESLLRMPAVKARTGLGRTSILNRVKRGDFPKPLKLGARCIAWPSREIDSWIEQQIAESRRGAA